MPKVPAWNFRGDQRPSATNCTNVGPLEPQANGQEVKYMYFTYLAHPFSQLGVFSGLTKICC
jgi:hypothetical protein